MQDKRVYPRPACVAVAVDPRVYRRFVHVLAERTNTSDGVQSWAKETKAGVLLLSAARLEESRCAH